MPTVNLLENWQGDASGLVRAQRLESVLTLTNAKRAKAITFPAPLGADYGLEGKFRMPAGYSSAPKIVAAGVLGGTPAGTLALAYQDLPVALSESVDAAYGSEKTASNGTWTGYVAKDIYKLEITLTAGDYAAGDEVLYKFVRDATSDTFGGKFLLLTLELDYTAA